MSSKEKKHSCANIWIIFQNSELISSNELFENDSETQNDGYQYFAPKEILYCQRIIRKSLKSWCLHVIVPPPMQIPKVSSSYRRLDCSENNPMSAAGGSAHPALSCADRSRTPAPLTEPLSNLTRSFSAPKRKTSATSITERLWRSAPRGRRFSPTLRRPRPVPDAPGAAGARV